MSKPESSPPPAIDPAETPSPRFKPEEPGALGRFLVPAGEEHHSGEHAHKTHPWYGVLWLTGVDYFSTLGYQPGIAFLAAGALSPIATVILIAVTLLGALPVYSQVAARSYAGQGSIAMLERLLPGWAGKLFVLGLLGFAATDFVITMTLSAADAAQHAVENPLLRSTLGDQKLLITCGLLALLAAVFLRGFSEAIGLASAIAIPYLLLNLVVIGVGLHKLAVDPILFATWEGAVHARGSWTAILGVSVLIFPRLALGMSGFETGVSVMPLVRGAAGEAPGSPQGRIRNTRKLLLAAAVIMSLFLIGSSLVTSAMIPAAEFETGGKASGRALAYLAHELLGTGFGTVYDLSTILILWFAGASAMAGMLNLIPRYLPRYGMVPRWVEHPRPLVLLLLAVDLLVTVFFDADVEAQGGAYATGVLVLMLSASVAVALALWKELLPDATGKPSRRRGLSLFFWLITLVLAYTLVENVRERPDGVIIAGLFTLAILVASAASRFRRSTELRVEQLEFVDAESKELWESLRGKKVNLIPVGAIDPGLLQAKAARLRRHYKAGGPIAFIHVDLADDTSEFKAKLRARVQRDGDGYLVHVTGAVAIANTIAWVSEQLDPIALYLELSLHNPVTQALKYLLWGEGETGVLVYEILVRYWHSTPDDDVRPLIFLVSQ